MEGLSEAEVIEEFGTFDFNLSVGSPLLEKCEFWTYPLRGGGLYLEL